jgi:hypothetical protein
MPNVTQLTLANEVFHRLMKYGSQHEPATRLVASAAFQVGFARIAAGMAIWSREPEGHNEMQLHLSDEQFDVLMLAPVDAAARTSVTCMDLCAAAAYRLTGAPELHHGQESSVQHLLNSVNQNNVSLAASQAGWLHTLVESADWQLLRRARTAVTHREIESLSAVGVGRAVTSLIIEGTPYDNVDMTGRFAHLAETQFNNFTTAVLQDFP